jgi:DMSO/TMAO reductase YedYZ heme-binding membrane subunit
VSMRRVPDWLRYLAIVGNLVFLLWVLYNGINEGFRATPVQFASYFGVMALFVVNAAILALDGRRDVLDARAEKRGP